MWPLAKGFSQGQLVRVTVLVNSVGMPSVALTDLSPGSFYLAPGIHVVVDGVWEAGLLKATSKVREALAYPDARGVLLD